MDIITIFNTLFKWGILALIGTVLLLLILMGGYHFIYKKILRGTHQFNKKQWLITFLLLCWLLIVLALTTLSRGANYTGALNIDFFSGYKNAWNKWSATELQLIIFNMLMFTPLGFFLPLLWQKAKRFPIIIVASLTVTIGIEILQFVTARGIFELDDLIHNLLGSLFGYFCITGIISCLEKRKILIVPLLKLLLIPCIVGAVILSAIFLYKSQPYGNMTILPAVKQDMSKIEIITELNFSQDRSTASIYKNHFADDKTHMQKIISLFSEITNNTFSNSSRAEGENKIILGKQEDGTDVQLNYFIRSGTWQFNSWKDWVKLSDAQVIKLQEKYESWLIQNRLLPADYQFTVENKDTLRWYCQIPDNLTDKTEDFVQGSVLAQFDKSKQVSTFGYQMMWNEYITTEDIISPEQAYQEVLKGNFEQYIPFQSGDQLFITDFKISYTYDTKGYYQPVYQFSGYINTTENTWVCRIPALEK